VTIAKEEYIPHEETVVISPSSSTIRNFSLWPISSLGDPIVNSISTGYPGHVYFLEGVEKVVTFGATIDWSGHTPDKAIFFTSIGQYDVMTSDSYASRDLDVGDEFSTCDPLYVQGVAQDGATSSLKEADITIMSSPPLVPWFDVMDYGDSISYISGLDFDFGLIDEGIAYGIIPTDIPLFGTEGFTLRWIPKTTVEVTSSGTANYNLVWDDNVKLEGSMAGLSYCVDPQRLDIYGDFLRHQCLWDWSGSFEVYGEIGLSATWPMPIVIPCYAKATISGSMNADVFIDNLIPLTMFGDLKIRPGIRGSLGAGVDEWADLETWIYGDVDFWLQWPHTPTLEKVTIHIDAGIESTILGVAFYALLTSNLTFSETHSSRALYS